METQTQHAFVSALKDILDPQSIVLADQAEPYLNDIQNMGAPCLLVARPSTTEDVSAVVKLCHAHNIAIVSQGGNTNVCGMAVPLEGQTAIVLSLARMNRIIDINPSGFTATVEAGVVMQNLQDAALAVDRVFAPD